MKILVVNGGSSSFKFALFDSANFSRQTQPIWKKQVEFKNTQEDRKSSVEKILSEIKEDIDIVGHRVVHGASFFQAPTLINPSVIADLKQISKLAPLHNPINIEGIELSEKQFPKAKQMAVFDTAFFSKMPEVAWTYPGPWKWREEGIRRYGFHGISHQYCSETLHELNASLRKTITCHLGNGASCSAILNGVAIDTTMGFTPMEGLMMGTRSGSIDPGILLYLLREGMTEDQINQCLNKESGLLGIGGSFDMRTIEKGVNEGNERAILAFNLYIYRLKQAIAALSTALEGVDAICFSGGIGENSQLVREKTCEGLKYLGVELETNLNKRTELDVEISSNTSKIKIYVVHTQEEWMIAKECLNFQ